MKTLTCLYKDAQRFYWKVIVKHVGSEPDAIHGDEHPNYVWDYEIFRSPDEKRFDLVYNSTITGSFDYDPDIRDIIKDWSSAFMDVFFGMVEYAKCEEIGN